MSKLTIRAIRYGLSDPKCRETLILNENDNIHKNEVQDIRLLDEY